jgi:hypothetical protein
MRTFLAVVASIVGILYILFLGWGAIRMGVGNRGVRKKQRWGGASYGQINSATGRTSPPKVGLSVWFFLLLVIGLIYALWFR